MGDTTGSDVRAARAIAGLAAWHVLSFGVCLALVAWWALPVDWVVVEMFVVMLAFGASLLVAAAKLRHGRGRVLAVTTLGIMSPMALGQLLFPPYVLLIRGLWEPVFLSLSAAYWVQVALYVRAWVAVCRAGQATPQAG